MERTELRALAARYGLGELLARAVLIVDDEAENLAVLSEFLDGDYQVYEASSGREALRLARSLDIDVVITDQRMPEMTGVELLEQLQQHRPDVASILLTAFTDTPALVSAINRARVFRHLRKPWQPEEVLGAVVQASEHVFQGRAIARLVDLLARRSEELGSTLEQLRRSQDERVRRACAAVAERATEVAARQVTLALEALAVAERELRAAAPARAATALGTGTEAVEAILSELAEVRREARDDPLGDAQESAGRKDNSP